MSQNCISWISVKTSDRPKRSEHAARGTLNHSDDVLIWYDAEDRKLRGAYLAYYNLNIKKFSVLVLGIYVDESRITHFAYINAPINVF